MKLDVKAMASTFAVIWGIVAMLVIGLVRLAWPDYAQEFISMMASVYPGMDATASFKNALVGGLYGLLDGAVCGALFALVYNHCVVKFARSAS